MAKNEFIMNFNGPVGEHIDTVKEMTVNIGSDGTVQEGFVWRKFADEQPKENDVVLVRGVCHGNGPEAASEFYVFIVENGEFNTDTGKPIKKYHLFEDYTFTHWAYIPEPKLD